MRTGVTKCKAGWRVDIRDGLTIRCVGVFATKALAEDAHSKAQGELHHKRNRTDVR